MKRNWVFSLFNVLPGLLFCTLFIVLSSCATMNPMVDVEKTWDEAYIRIPGLLPVSKEHREKYLSEMLADKKYPTVIYFHGAGGLNSPESRGDFDVLEELNLAVVAPHSYARKRPRWVRGGTSRDTSRQIVFIRKAEITFALEQVRRLSWVGQSNVFIWGHSEGGGALAAYPGAICKGRILTGTGCQWGFRSKDPVLVIQSKNDPYRDLWKGDWEWPTTCKRVGRGVNNLTYIELPGGIHPGGQHPDGKRAIKEFIDRLYTSP